VTAQSAALNIGGDFGSQFAITDQKKMRVWAQLCGLLNDFDEEPTIFLFLKAADMANNKDVLRNSEPVSQVRIGQGGGVPEIVQDGLTGLLVPMGDVQAMADAICAILADPQKAATMGELAPQRVEKHFTVALTAGRVEAIYRQVLESRQTARGSA
jgi:Glycosyl transferases group 1